MNEIFDKLDAEFAARFGGRPAVHVRAPGRVNLIGEHTDYNDGFVFPMAIDRACHTAARRRDDGRVRIHTMNLGLTGEVPLDDLDVRPGREELWLNFLRATAHELREAKWPVSGADIAVFTTVPIGGGVSSSSAYAVALCLTLLAVAGETEPDRIELARLLQRTENRATGLRGGIMDQFTALLNRADHALLLDCRDLTFQHVPMALDGYRFIVTHCGLPRTLARSKYNERRAECDEAAAALGVRALRDASHDQLRAAEKQMPANVFRRARHVITEIARTREAARVFQRGDMASFGRLMNESHESLRHDYEASCRELDALVEAARAVPGVLGSRLTGAGWGGCTVTLIRSSADGDYERAVPARYARETGLRPVIITTGAARGAEVWTL
ncbi:MAG: galactokinase [Verrucomicrobiae bacterium]|nr:galactokinase [Verrucomicrobiae bacterium]